MAAKKALVGFLSTIRGTSVHMLVLPPECVYISDVMQTYIFTHVTHAAYALIHAQTHNTLERVFT